MANLSMSCESSMSQYTIHIACTGRVVTVAATADVTPYNSCSQDTAAVDRRHGRPAHSPLPQSLSVCLYGVQLLTAVTERHHTTAQLSWLLADCGGGGGGDWDHEGNANFAKQASAGSACYTNIMKALARPRGHWTTLNIF